MLPKKRIHVADMIQAYCMKNIKRYEKINNMMKSVRAQSVRPTSGFSERDKVYDQDLFLAMKLRREEYEEGEIREED